MVFFRAGYWLTICSSLVATLALADPPSGSHAAVEHFEKKIRPLLIAKCYACHSEEKGKSKGGLTLDTPPGWRKGGDSGPAVVPGKPDESLLIKAVRYSDASLRMPPKSHGGRLADAEIAELEKWVRQGAADPRGQAVRPSDNPNESGKNWWAFQPVTEPTIPNFTGQGISNPIDAFIVAKLREKGVQTSSLTEKRSLLRRATFDLTGLPPTPEELQSFLADASPDAYAKVIDRLLVSPHYGEKWGRHWLDVVRYADSLDDRAYDKDGDILDAWRYRDWVVAAFNRDLPYDQFIVQQLAGDILAAAPGKWDRDLIIATGMYAIGNWGNGDADKEKLHTDIVDDQVDVTSRAFLGVTLACARCHDHKFDPFTTRDYYALSGFFFSSHILDKFQSKGEGEKLMRIPLLSPQEKARQEELRRQISAVDAELAKTMRPFDDFRDNVAGQASLKAWLIKGTDNPSLVINTAKTQASFGTIKMAAESIALHPGRTTAASAVWRSPITGPVKLRITLRDDDPNCGDGVRWEVWHGTKLLQSGEMNNGGMVNLPEIACQVKESELIRLSVHPRKEYTCDTTEVEFKVVCDPGKTWDLRKDLVTGGRQGHGGVWWICSGAGDQLADDDQQAKRLAQKRKRLVSELGETAFAQGILEGGIAGTPYAGFHDAKIHVRGSYNRLGEPAPRGVPFLLTRKPVHVKAGSGRLELARWIASPEHPLTARVMVNRIWQQHFGEGLVRTANNFGKLGTPPTHPELLDYLAMRFVQSGWSVKVMHRLIMTSETYQRSSRPASHGVADPENVWLGRQQRRRLSAEELRDAMLAATGELDRTLGGKAIRDLNSKRRTLYVTTIRSDRANYQSLFDAADPTSIVEKRTEATVAPQALWLMNHPFVQDRAAALARRTAAQPGSTSQKLQALCAGLFARPPTAAEIDLAARAIPQPDDPKNWERLCQVLLCCNEFIYVD